MNFNDLPLEAELLDGLQAMNFKEATPIQEKAIPLILDKKDIIACAQTGTGKTAAYLLPILNILCQRKHPEDKINALIVLALNAFDDIYLRVEVIVIGQQRLPALLYVAEVDKLAVICSNPLWQLFGVV